MDDLAAVSNAFNSDELETALNLLKEQSYFSEYNVLLGISFRGHQGKIIEALKEMGWGGKIMPHATDCGKEGWIHSCFDPDELRIHTVDALVRDEAESQQDSEK